MKDSMKKLLEPIKKFGEVATCKISTQKSTEFLDTKNELSEGWIEKKIPFSIVSKRRKYLGINLSNEVKDLYVENSKTLKGNWRHK